MFIDQMIKMPKQVTLKWAGYDSLSIEAQEAAKAAATRIHMAQEAMVSNAADLGEALIEAKEALDHGQWGQWLEGEFGWTNRTAQHWMNAAMAVRKNETFSLLPSSAQYALGSKTTPDAAVEEIAERIEQGETPTVAEVKATIQTHKAKTTYTQDEPPAPSSAPAERTKATPGPVTPAKATYTGERADPQAQGGADEEGETNAPAEYITATIRRDVALVLIDAAHRGGLDNVMTWPDAEELFSALSAAVYGPA